ncbi:hypothetical protein HK096_000509, partial [Nowakowskiella sp. JEL0078]
LISVLWCTTTGRCTGYPTLPKPIPVPIPAPAPAPPAPAPPAPAPPAPQPPYYQPIIPIDKIIFEVGLIILLTIIISSIIFVCLNKFNNQTNIAPEISETIETALTHNRRSLDMEAPSVMTFNSDGSVSISRNLTPFLAASIISGRRMKPSSEVNRESPTHRRCRSLNSDFSLPPYSEVMFQSSEKYKLLDEQYQSKAERVRTQSDTPEFDLYLQRKHNQKLNTMLSYSEESIENDIEKWNLRIEENLSAIDFDIEELEVHRENNTNKEKYKGTKRFIDKILRSKIKIDSK